jgi:hypothetical protein
MGKKDKKKDGGKKLDRKIYESALFDLQAELVKLQRWVVAKGERVIVVFEGRDAAGKGGVIKRITERVSPRIFRVVALPAPTEREKSQLYLQRYIAHCYSTAAGTTGPASSEYWSFAPKRSTAAFCWDARYSKKAWWTMESGCSSTGSMSAARNRSDACRRA